MTTYGQLCSEFYDLDKPGPPPDAFDFYERYAQNADGLIVEPMCGSGRFLLPLLAQGLDIEGSDTSPEMLGACRKRAGALGLSPRLAEHSLEQLRPSAPAALIFIPSGSFGLLLEQNSVQRSVRAVHTALQTAGTFLVEVELQQTCSPQSSGGWGGRWVERADGSKLILSWLEQYSGQPNVALSLHRYELVQNGQLQAVEFEEFRVRSYTCAEFRQLLEEAGFREIRALKPYAEAPHDAEDEAIVFACRK
jgi:SAM-dependent methyltransferase